MKFKDMNVWSKVLFVIAIISIVDAVLCVVIGIAAIVGAGSLGADLLGRVSNALAANGIADMTAVDAVKYSGIALIIYAVLESVVALLELRAAKDNKKIMLPFIIACVGMVLYVIGFFRSGLANVDALQIATDLIEFVACLMVFINSKKSA